MALVEQIDTNHATEGQVVERFASMSNEYYVVCDVKVRQKRRGYTETSRESKKAREGEEGGERETDL
jgi:hypothetical protein